MLQWLKLKAEPVNAVIRHFDSIAAPAATTPVQDVPFLVLDLETTGLDAKKDYIVSIGWVVVIHQEIQLSQARHYLIAAPVSVGQSAVFHGLHDKDLRQARDLAEVLTELLTEYAGYYFVAHHAQLEQGFLQVACQRCFGKTAKIKFLDTLKMEWQRLHQQGKVVKTDALRLHACLQRHHLPASQQHHALADAYSCALLLLSQIKQSQDHLLRLEDLLYLSRG